MDNFSETCDLFFELSNEDRMRILFHIREEPSNITTIAKTLDLSTQEVSRHVSRLMDKMIVKRDVEGNICIDGFGRSLMFSMPYYQFISTHREYFNTHPIFEIPAEFLSRLYELGDSILISDPMTVFQRTQIMCEESKEYICRLTDKHLNIIYPNLQAAADRGVDFRLLEPLEVEPTPGSEIKPRVVPSRTRGLNQIPVFLAFSEKEVAAIAFPHERNNFDYQGFSSKSPDAIKWCRDVFEYYWEKGTPVM